MSKAKLIALWALQILLALLFLMTSFFKLSSSPAMVGMFRTWGYPENFYLLIGVLEGLGAIGLLIPKLAGYAATGLLGIMLGALFTHLLHGESQAIVPGTLMILLAFVAYAKRPGFLRKRQEQAG